MQQIVKHEGNAVVVLLLLMMVTGVVGTDYWYGREIVVDAEGPFVVVVGAVPLGR